MEIICNLPGRRCVVPAMRPTDEAKSGVAKPVPVTRGLRVWPGVVLVAVQWGLRFLLPAIWPETLMVAVMGSLGLGLGVVGWWLCFSRAPWGERLGVAAGAALGVAVTSRIVHPSIAGGMMGMMLPIFATPVLCLALVGAVVATRRAGARVRRGAIGVALAAGCGGFLLVRTDGISSDAESAWHWRWTPTAEERMLAKRAAETTAAAPTAVAATATARGMAATAAGAAGADEVVWPGFRGPRRDGVLAGVRIDPEWHARPPVEVWRREVGPGWSSFAVAGGLVFTQEQRGEQEVVACYRLATGEPVWTHGEPVRFYESNAGAGPRGTPTVHEGRVYALGATGVLHALDARTGARIWRRDAAQDAGKTAPEWGFSSSPLVWGDLVIVAATGTLAAYERATGAPRWQGPQDGKSYSSPHLVELGGVPQVLLMSGKGATSVAPADGAVLWTHAWENFAIVQPAVLGAGELLISTGDRAGARRIAVAASGGTWTVEERWTSIRLKPYFNDFVLHRGHAYGFDSGILACIELGEGRAVWKGGRYGRGQVLLLADQDLLVVATEQGEVALVAAKPEGFTELARRPAVTGKTWNHPVLAGDLLLVRNDREMVALRLALRRE